jgi:hypothetical protein
MIIAKIGTFLSNAVYHASSRGTAEISSRDIRRRF